jgi:hypothetical protein
MSVSPNKTAGQSYYIEIANKSSENVAKLKYCIHEEIKSRLSSGDACYHALQNLLSSNLVPKNMRDENMWNYRVIKKSCKPY